MKRIAIFVEGYTEVMFVQRLVEEVAGAENVLIDSKRITGGSTAMRRVITIEAARPVDDEKFYFLIFDCGGDRQVKSRILEEHSGLTIAGYERIIGIRDVRPDFGQPDIARLELGLRTGIKTRLIPVEFILCVLEIEAWFLSEFTHFQKIDPSITTELISRHLGFNPETDDMSQRQMPANDLNSCYALVGKNYQKAKSDTCDALDYGEIYFNLPAKIPYLNRLTSALNAFLVP